MTTAFVGTRGFQRLTRYLSEAGQVGGEEAVRMRMLARAYVAFALDYSMLFRLMFSSELFAIDDAALYQKQLSCSESRTRDIKRCLLVTEWLRRLPVIWFLEPNRL